MLRHGKLKMSGEQERMKYNICRGRLSAGQQRILDAIDEWAKHNPEPATTRQISDMADISQTYVQRLLIPLELAGYITVLRDRDGKAYHTGCIVNQFNNDSKERISMNRKEIRELDEVMVIEQQIKQCTDCGRKPDDMKDGVLRGYGDQCVWCGAMDKAWQVACPCGNEQLWYLDTLDSECPTCKMDSDKYIITHVDSAFVIEHILERPDLHRERSWIPASFVETLMDMQKISKEESS